MMKELALKHPYLLATMWLGTVVTAGSVLISHFATRKAEADSAAPPAIPPAK